MPPTLTPRSRPGRRPSGGRRSARRGGRRARAAPSSNAAATASASVMLALDQASRPAPSAPGEVLALARRRGRRARRPRRRARADASTTLRADEPGAACDQRLASARQLSSSHRPSIGGVAPLPHPTRSPSFAPPCSSAAAALDRRRRREAQPRAPAEARARRLLDQRGDAARPDRRRAAARGRRAPARPSSTAILGASAERIEVAGPGFLNVFLSDRWHREATAELLAAGERLGASAGRRARAGPGRVRERQPDRSGDRRQRPRGGLRRLARAPARARRRTRSSASTTSTTPAPRSACSPRRSPPGCAATSRPRAATRASTSASSPTSSPRAGAGPDDLERARAARRRGDAGADRGRRWSASASRFDTWSSERGAARVRARSSARSSALREHGHVYEHDGAVWLRTTEFGDDKDRVLIRADGEPTYFAPDIAYHLDKLERGHERLINVLGADHHGYVPRMRAALAALEHRARSASRRRSCRWSTSSRAASAARMSKRTRRLRHPRRAGRRHRRRRDPLLHAPAQPRHRDRHRPRAGAVGLAGQPRLLRPVRARADREHPAQGGRRGRRAPDEDEIAAAAAAEEALAAAAEPSRAGARPPAARASGRGRDSPPSAARRTASAPTRWRPPPTSTPSIATAAWSAPSEPGAEAARLGLCVATKRTIATTLGLLGVSAPERM